jgi:hypothetical protein
MPVKYFPVTIDSSAILKPDSAGGGSLGQGNDWHLPIGMNGGYVMRAALKFNADFTGMASITSASLYVKTANSNDGTKNGYLRDTHGTPNTGNLKISRITKSWSEGTYGNDEIWNGLNSTEWSTFATGSTNAYINTTTGITTSGEVTVGSGSTTRGVVLNYSITDIVRAWAPTSVTSGGGQTNYGILIRMATEVAEVTGDFIEFYSKQAYDYGTAYGAGTAGTSGDWVGGVNGSASYIAVTYVEAVTATPSVTLVSPSAGGIAPISNLNEVAEWNTSGKHALPTFTWSTSGGTGDQTSWWLSIYSDPGATTPIYYSGQVTDATHGSDKTFSIPKNADAPAWLSTASGYTGWTDTTPANQGLVNGTAYYWTMEVWDSNGVSSTESGTSSFKVRWGQAIYGWDSANTSNTGWAFNYSAPPANTQASVLYRATSTISATSGAWTDDLGSLVGTERYLQTLVRLSSDNGTKPYLTDMTFTYTSGAVPPDNWTVDTGTLVLDSEQHRFGTKSVLWTATGTGPSFIQTNRSTVGATPQYDVSVIPNTRYTMSAFVKPVDLSGRALKLRVYRGDGSTAAITNSEIADVNGTLGSANYASFTPDNEGWHRMTYTFIAPTGVTFVKPTLHLYGTGSVGDKVYVDGVQFEEGSVVRSWTPGFVTQAVTYEGAGIAVDASKGGNLRLRAKGSTPGSPTARDVIEIGERGLAFGGSSYPVEIYSSNPSQLDFAAGGAVGASVISSGLYLPPGKTVTFEGATSDASEVILTAEDATAGDKTITLPNATGTVALTNSRFAENQIAIPGANTTITTSVGALNGLSITFTPTYTEQVVVIAHVVIIQSASPTSAVNMNIRAQLDGVGFSEFGYVSLAANHSSPNAFTLGLTSGFQAVAGTTYTVRVVASKSANVGTFVANSTGSSLFLVRTRE